MRRLLEIPAGEYIVIDHCEMAWAACELVALSFGQGGRGQLGDSVLELVARLPPSETQRRLALKAVPRLLDRATSELAALWHEGPDGAQLDATLAQLQARLEAASAGPREPPRPRRRARTGDALPLPFRPPSKGCDPEE